MSKEKGPMRPGMAPTSKAKDFKGTLKKLIGYISKYKVAIIIVWMFRQYFQL